jgi:hypothetical protein
MTLLLYQPWSLLHRLSIVFRVTSLFRISLVLTLRIPRGKECCLVHLSFLFTTSPTTTYLSKQLLIIQTFPENLEHYITASYRYSHHAIQVQGRAPLREAQGRS